MATIMISLATCFDADEKKDKSKHDEILNLLTDKGFKVHFSEESKEPKEVDFHSILTLEETEA